MVNGDVTLAVPSRYIHAGGDARGTAGDVIRGLVCGYGATARAKKLMVMLHAFVDDSASDSGDRRLFLAGYVNTAEKWEVFSNAWERELKQAPAIRYFKMSEAASLGGQFSGWNEVARNNKVLALARIIRQSNPWFVYCSVSRVEYAAILAPAAPYPLKTPYFDCFWGIVHTAARYRAEFMPADSPPIDFIFDEQGGTGRDAVLWYDWLKQDQTPAIKASLGSTPIFRDDKDVVGLQAADMLAWHLRRDHQYQGREDRPIAKILMTEGAGVDIDAGSLREAAKKFRGVPGVRFVQTKAAWREARKGTQALLAAGARPAEIGFRHRWLVAKYRLAEAINRFRYPRRRR